MCQKHPKHHLDSGKVEVRQYIMPGGTIEEGEDHLTCLQREVDEELATQVTDPQYIATYEAPAAGHTDGSKVRIALYQGTLVDQPQPSGEIAALHWIGASDRDNEMVSEIIREYILPDTIEKGILSS
ncbi:MAG: NUDIX domain-containing protein [Candidatus Peribacteria bacterium]|nr:MAG: NUDIX domain-containing protein [Candidatus Peribacteria bacterium]